ncbi:MAG: hypothetical protein ACREEM_21850, partial [Blastocatellia bacterium]
ESSTGDDYIKTVPRRGYRFVAAVRESWGEEGLDIPTAELMRRVDLKEKKIAETFPRIGAAAVVKLKEYVAEKERAAEPASPVERPAPAPPVMDVPGKPNRKPVVIGAIGLLVIAASVVAWLLVRANRSSAPFANPTIANLTMAGNLQCIAVSPDGKYVVFGRTDKTRISSLNLLQLSTSSARVILPAEEAQYHAVTISPDGGFIYFVKVRNDVPNRTLYRVPLFGGEVKKLLDNVETGVAFSPDGKQIAFRRGANERREALLLVANADGTGEREVASIKYPETFNDPAWSPDGNVIAASAGHAEGGKNRYIVAVRTRDWTARTVHPERWQWIGQMAWLPDSSGLVMVGNREASEPIQIWHLSYPSGETRRITNDSNSYSRLSLSADGRLMTALHQKRVTSLWIAPADEIRNAQQVTFGAGGYRGQLSWTPEGRIVFDSEAGNTTAISIMDADGSNQRHLTSDAAGPEINGYSTVTGDGRYIVYFSDLSGVRHIWRMNADGGNPIQLTNGKGEDHPACSPDGNWVVFTQKEVAGLSHPTLSKVPIDGGPPAQLNQAFAGFPAVSPDGKMIACAYSPRLNTPWQPAVLSFEDGHLLKLFPQPLKGSPQLRWTPDGRAIAYVDYPVGLSRLWVQPLEGGAPKPLLELETDRIFGFDWSRDGKRLAYVRGFWALNAVTVTDAK